MYNVYSIYTVALSADVAEHGNIIEDDGHTLKYLAGLHRAGTRFDLQQKKLK